MTSSKLHTRLILALVLAMGALGHAQAQDLQGESSEANLYTMADNVMITHSWSKLVRTDHAVSMALKTQGLEPDSPYTVWWVIFNNPGACSAAPDGDPGVPVCDTDDLFNADGAFDPRPLPRSSFVWATGGMSDAEGHAFFSAYLEEGDPLGFVSFGPALEDARHAAIHLVVRAHGPTDPDSLYQQLYTPEDDGVNVQAAVHDSL